MLSPRIFEGIHPGEEGSVRGTWRRGVRNRGIERSERVRCGSGPALQQAEGVSCQRPFSPVIQLRVPTRFPARVEELLSIRKFLLHVQRSGGAACHRAHHGGQGRNRRVQGDEVPSVDQS